MSQSPPRPKRYFIETFGCQMNVNDSEKVAGLLQARGYEAVDSARQADAVFINTCAVREKAAQKLSHAVGRLKRLRKSNPDLKIAVGGCVAQLHGSELLERSPEIDLMVGTHNLTAVPALLDRAWAGETGLLELDRKADRFAVPDEQVVHGNPVRAYVTAMEGCNHVCSFCVVPRTRGPEVCRPAAAIVAEVESLVARGFPEVMLLGQTVNAYQQADVDFVGLLERVAAVPGLQRLRFTTSHPEHVDQRLAGAWARLDKVCPYLHLPVQSGSDRLLASMRRGYTAAEYVEKVELLRRARPDLALTSDVICGYPGETEADFEATLRLVERCRFEGLFVFAYSARPGTTALRLEDDVPEDEKLRRVNVLNSLQQRAQEARNQARVGRLERVLVEGRDEAKGRLFGRSEHFRLVHFQGAADLKGRLCDVRVTLAGANALLGELVSTGQR